MSLGRRGAEARNSPGRHRCRGPSLWVLALVAAAAACGPSASEDEAWLETLEVPEGGYRMRYLSPPWELDEISGTYARLFIEPNGYRFVGSIAIPAKYDLTLDIEPGFARARAEAELAEMATAGYVERVGPRELITASGDVGWEVLGRDETILFRNHRVIFFESTSGVLRVHLEGYPELDEGEMNRMLSSIEPRVEPEA